MNNLEIAVLGGGCFWCLDAVYRKVEGVETVVSGYAGGNVENPTDDVIYSGHSGHAEVVQITFNPSIISYRELLEIFFVIHDPTSFNRQGYDVGPMYRSVIFYNTPEQRGIAEEVINELTQNGAYDKKILTKIEPLKDFCSADEHHQNFYNKYPGRGYCQVIINPKLAKFKEHFAEKMKEE